MEACLAGHEGSEIFEGTFLELGIASLDGLWGKLVDAIVSEVKAIHGQLIKSGDGTLSVCCCDVH